METPEQHELVREAGVPHSQGFLYARPVDGETLAGMLLLDDLV